MNEIRKLLVANRSEIAIRVFRSATELGIRTVALYAYEDRYSLHRFKADEAYQVGQPGEPIKSYLDIPAIIAIAKAHSVDAIHPGYGFLAENPRFAAACEAAGIRFVGPSVEALERLGDKTAARTIAEQAGVAVLGGSGAAVADAAEGLAAARAVGFPIILKAAHGGGGRGMRVVETEEAFEGAFEQARRESLAAFGSPDIFVEKFIQRARHIEVQLLGDWHGNLLHLYERDCSVQRRHQKVVEIAPAPNLTPSVRDAICAAAVKIGRQVGYSGAGTVEFLVDADTDRFFFIEVNPRIQVEHTVTEEVTGVDIVRAQILVARGMPLSDPEIDLPCQAAVSTHGFALQCRVTTEDPTNNFMPDYGRVAHYRAGGGLGIRQDGGNAFSGALVNPYYDSLLVKVTARGRRFIDAVRRMRRDLHEFRIRGVKTNIPFLEKLLREEPFVRGECTTRYIDENPHLMEFKLQRDRASKLLAFIGHTIVNGNSLVKDRPVSLRRTPAPTPELALDEALPQGTRDTLRELGPERFAKWIGEQKRTFVTDTTFRDAHQSLLATRLRSADMLAISEGYARLAPQLFSLEMWGGATFDTAMRFLKECPWQRLEEMRGKIPNILFQMLLRSSNAVGYTNYPDNVVKAFVREAAAAGIDLFRVFDALNWTSNMRLAMETVVESGALCEAAICYTGDILDPSRSKYDLNYYVGMAKELERMGAHILAIKDMAGLCKPEAARLLVATLKQEVGIPIHFHTHDTSGIAAASILNAVEAGVDIVDAAMAPLSGGTSQPNLNTVVEALRFNPRATGLAPSRLDELAEYWRSAREFYTPFESPVLPATADLYHHEIPGGQYTNLYAQALALGLADRWAEVCRVYAEVNRLFGDIVKVTPTSKAVGDMALFMVANGLSGEDVLDKDRELAFPASVVDLIGGHMGHPYQGFPEAVVKRILRGEEPLKGRPGDTLEPADFEAAKEVVRGLILQEPNTQQVVSHLLYPKVYEEFARHQVEYYDTSGLPTPVFFYGMKEGEEIAVEIERGKTLIIRYLTVGAPTVEGIRTVFFELNGHPRDVSVRDLSIEQAESGRRPRADAGNPAHLGSAMPGMVVNVAVSVGDWVRKGQKLLVLEAMKMESTVYAERDGKVRELPVHPGTQVQSGDLLAVIE
ncbi:pyruvate carboxylase [Endothiovibrio diazotrophicus]